MLTRRIAGAQLEIIVADITTLSVDAIVNAANSCIRVVTSEFFRGAVYAATPQNIGGSIKNSDIIAPLTSDSALHIFHPPVSTRAI